MCVASPAAYITVCEELNLPVWRGRDHRMLLYPAQAMREGCWGPASVVLHSAAPGMGPVGERCKRRAQKI